MTSQCDSGTKASGRPRAPKQTHTGRQATARQAGPAIEVLPSKIAVPELRPKLVRRTALVNRLLGARESRIVSISAPAGYGKSTLLAQWARRDRRPFAWVSLDARDNDPVVLLTYVAATLDNVSPLDRSIFRDLTTAGRSIWATALPRLGAALASADRPFVLVLDDLHELSSRDCLDAVDALAMHVPRGSQLVLAGRGEELGTARIRATGDLLELGLAELALTESEAQAVLSNAGAELAEGEIEHVIARSEGWAAGLYLAALSAGDAPDRAELWFAGDDRFVTDYFRAEHLSHLSKRDVQFLTRTALLERMTGPLCDAVLGRRDSARTLESLEERNLFVIPLDHHREWYRYHHLFRDMLQIRARAP